jgi:hypothetical protein
MSAKARFAVVFLGVLWVGLATLHWLRLFREHTDGRVAALAQRAQNAAQRASESGEERHNQ